MNFFQVVQRLNLTVQFEVCKGDCLKLLVNLKHTRNKILLLRNFTYPSIYTDNNDFHLITGTYKNVISLARKIYYFVSKTKNEYYVYQFFQLDPLLYNISRINLFQEYSQYNEEEACRINSHIF